MSVTIEGIPELKTAFAIFQQKLFNLATTLVDETAKEGAKYAKQQLEIGAEKGPSAVDTGALQASVEGGITKIEPMVEVEGQVGAGKNEVIRGQGSYKLSRKTGYGVKPEPTSNYAGDVEHGRGFSAKIGSRPYMTNTYIYLRDLMPKKAMKILREAIKRV